MFAEGTCRWDRFGTAALRPLRCALMPQGEFRDILHIIGLRILSHVGCAENAAKPRPLVQLDTYWLFATVLVQTAGGSVHDQVWRPRDPLVMA